MVKKKIYDSHIPEYVLSTDAKTFNTTLSQWNKPEEGKTLRVDKSTKPPPIQTKFSSNMESKPSLVDTPDTRI